MVSQVAFWLDFDSGNQAIVDAPHEATAHILERVLEQFKSGREGAVIKDINGNTIGNWGISIEEECENHF